MDKILKKLYKQKIIDLYKSPLNVGKLHDYTTICEYSNLSCGDETKIYLKIINGIVNDVSHVSNGCALSIASISLFTEYIKEKKISDILKIKEEKLFDLLKIPITKGRIKCVMLPLVAIKNKFT